MLETIFGFTTYESAVTQRRKMHRDKFPDPLVHNASWKNVENSASANGFIKNRESFLCFTRV